MRKSNSSNAGFTLLELLVSAALLLILIVPLLSFMRFSQAARNTTVRVTDIEQNARAALITIGRDIENAGFSFAPSIPLVNSNFINTLTGATLAPSVISSNGQNIETTDNILTPIVPGNNLNQITLTNASGAPVINDTDQVTLFAVDQSFNNGLPIPGQINSGGGSGYQFTSSNNVTITDLYPGDFVLLNRNGIFAVGTVTSVTAGSSNSTVQLSTGDANGFNQAPRSASTNPITLQPGLALLNPNNTTDPPTTLYRFFAITYYVDRGGNLIRRERLAPPHTNTGGNNSLTSAAITPLGTTYTCGTNNTTCYVDNIIATGVEDMQFRYNVVDPSNLGLQGFISDPGRRGANSPTNGEPANRGNSPTYRLLDIRQVEVTLRVRASERDAQLRDPNNRKQGYLYRYGVTGTFNSRNFYNSDFRPLNN
jgi:prepilin-type N-terminal cleavage/methylation domain-containing protein